MRGYYKRRIDELEAPSLARNEIPSLRRLVRAIPKPKKEKEEEEEEETPKKEDPRDAEATVVDKTPKPKPRTPAGPALPPGPRQTEPSRLALPSGPRQEEPSRLRAKPETSVGEPERRVSRQRREDPRTTTETPPREEPKAETPPREEPKAETPPKEEPKRKPSERWERMSQNAKNAFLRRTKIPGPEGEAAKKALEAMGVSITEHFIRIGTLIAESLGLF